MRLEVALVHWRNGENISRLGWPNRKYILGHMKIDTYGGGFLHNPDLVNSLTAEDWFADDWVLLTEKKQPDKLKRYSLRSMKMSAVDQRFGSVLFDAHEMVEDPCGNWVQLPENHTGMTCEEALLFLKAGKKIREKSWSKERYVFLGLLGDLLDNTGNGFSFIEDDIWGEWELFS
jgi:hypothetical protein